MQCVYAATGHGRHIFVLVKTLHEFKMGRLESCEILKKLCTGLEASVTSDAPEHLAASNGPSSNFPDDRTWVSKQTRHSDQDAHFTAEGDYRLRLPFSNSSELTMDILCHLPDVRVVAPESQRERTRD